MAPDRTNPPAKGSGDSVEAAPRPPNAPQWLGPAQVTVGLLLYTLLAILAAAATVLMIPLRIASVLVPVSIAFAVAANVVLPLLVRQLVQRSLAAALPVAAWFLTLAVMAGSRPEGDVLVPGGKAYASLTYVFYAVAIVGIGAGVITVVRSEPRRTIRVIAPAGIPRKSTAPRVEPAAKPAAKPMPARPARRSKRS
ncbi:MAG: hypothetical protein JWM76_97 [Pseudonocardiales bacterium]|nr:hypothetical protein [Pseudonocardiales bacterium]